MVYAHCNDRSVISKKLTVMLSKIAILAHLVLKRILEYLLGTQKKFKEYSNTIPLSLIEYVMILDTSGSQSVGIHSLTGNKLLLHAMILLLMIMSILIFVALLIYYRH